jgi:hypothetical protein
MRDLTARLSQLAPEAANALKVIAYFDQLGQHSAVRAPRCPRGDSRAVPGAPQGRVRAARLEEFVVAAQLDDPAAVHDRHPVRVV